MSEFNSDSIAVERDGGIVSLSKLGHTPNKKSVIHEIQEHIIATMADLNTNNKIANPVSFSFKCSDLLDPKPDKFTKFIKGINNLCPIIYWFEISPIGDKQSIIDAIDTCRKTNDFKVPPTNDTEETSDNILYVGKVRNNFKARVSQHLGYGYSKTWSLQLRHWASDLDLNLTLNYIQFNNTPDENTLGDIKLAIYEQCVAEKLKPILGKHSL